MLGRILHGAGRRVAEEGAGLGSFRIKPTRNEAWPIGLSVVLLLGIIACVLFSESRDGLIKKLQFARKTEKLESEIEFTMERQNEVGLSLVDKSHLPEALEVFRKMFTVGFRAELLLTRVEAQRLGLAESFYTCIPDDDYKRYKETGVVPRATMLEDCPIGDVVPKLRSLAREVRPSDFKLWLRRIPRR